MGGRSIQGLAGGEGITLAALFILVISIAGVPLFLLFKIGLSDEQGLSVSLVSETLQSRSVVRALWHSLETSAVSALLATLMGLGLALLIGITDVRFKGTFVFLILLPMMIPPHVTAIAWIQALGPASPVLQALGVAPAPGTPHPIYSAGGIIAVLTVQHAPLGFLAVRAALRSFPREVSDAARVSGASGRLALQRIIVPLLMPSLLAAFSLTFVAALGNFGINALLGIPARYTTLPVLIWRRLASFGPDVLPNVAVISILLALVAVAALLVQVGLLSRMRRTLIGLPQQALAFRLGPIRPLCEIALVLLVAATLVLPLTALVATALVPTYGVPLSLETLTFDNLIEVAFRQGVTLRAFANSAVTAGTAALAIAGISILLGHFLTSRVGALRRPAEALAGLSEVSYAVPGLVISIAFILAFIRPLPVIGISLYGTLWIILLAYLAAFLAIGLKAVTAAYSQLDPGLDDAARLAGAPYLYRMRRIQGPLVAPAAATGAILVFLTAYNEVTVSALLWSAGNETIGTVIFNYEDGGYTTLAAAMSTLTVLATAGLMLALNRVGRYLPEGVVPWRA